jgi:hypothetical protein
MFLGIFGQKPLKIHFVITFFELPRQGLSIGVKFFFVILVRVPPYSQKSEKKTFYLDITIHTPIESPCRGFTKYVVTQNIYS